MSAFFEHLVVESFILKKPILQSTVKQSRRLTEVKIPASPIHLVSSEFLVATLENPEPPELLIEHGEISGLQCLEAFHHFHQTKAPMPESLVPVSSQDAVRFLSSPTYSSLSPELFRALYRVAGILAKIKKPNSEYFGLMKLLHRGFYFLTDKSRSAGHYHLQHLCKVAVRFFEKTLLTEGSVTPGFEIIEKIFVFSALSLVEETLFGDEQSKLDQAEINFLCDLLEGYFSNRPTWIITRRIA